MDLRTRWTPAAVALGLVADGVWRRSRAARLNVLPPPARTDDAQADEDAGDFRFVTAAGVDVDPATRAAALSHAAREGLDVLELVPAGLDTARALELLRRLDPASYRAARLARGETAGHAVVVRADVLRRARADDVLDRPDGLSPAELDALAVKLKRHAPTTTDVAVAPDLAARPAAAFTPRDRRAVLRTRWHLDLPTHLATVLGGFAAAALFAARRPGPAAAVLAAACAQPYLATAGTPLRPRDRGRFALLRPVAAPARWAQVALAREEQDPDLPRLRARYQNDLALGVERFLEPPRTDCPWCGSHSPRPYITSLDYQQRKPGTFRLDRCTSCGHVFQNPRLNEAGLEFYYRDYYDGIGEAEVERGFQLSGEHYRARAGMLRGRAVPRAWLDVGGGHGHFCNAARDIWPDTRFDALDFGSGIIEAERRGWVDLAHYGQFRDLADKLVGSYDVVSMHHYLEHTLDPLAELDAAARVLPAGGHLLIEVPDPESPVARLAKRWWHNWFQPQHLHFIPVDNLVEALAARGLRTVAVDRGTAHQHIDLLMVVMLMLNRVAPVHPDRPWAPPGRRLPRVAARVALTLAGTPLMVAAGTADQLARPFVHRFGGANTYRVLARKEDVTGA
ncbi:class I SAM-dependent methyltransferase [Actinomadura rayongensis]|uniref:Methyltransferase domain-containing protein n=1 Tax=Actinomadura rayongensis TaxID=1429076 RepID=A0A6I4W908_9ACTN|nr:class I SAM-dependent methyltransferase [Actinomadura rayongensis]MXQ66637.1 methyltransferase domain-containing protein [Actinomadura rayongensis]